MFLEKEDKVWRIYCLFPQN